MVYFLSTCETRCLLLAAFIIQILSQKWQEIPVYISWVQADVAVR